MRKRLPRWHVIARTASRIATWFPPVALLLIYANWVVAWLELGRVPRLMLDDPKHVGSLTPGVHWVAVWTCVGGVWLFMASLFILAVMCFVRRENRRRSSIQLGVALISAALVYGWLWLDPGRVVEWFFD